MINNDDTNAFPYPISSNGISEPSESKGMTLRDYFAAKAMQGIISRLGDTPGSIADWAYQLADAMLERRKS